MKKGNQIYVLKSGSVHNMLEDSKHRLQYGIESVNHLYALYHGPAGKKVQGAPPQKDQDILRAMVVIAGAALDATVKSIIENSYHWLVDHDDLVRSEAAKTIHRVALKKLDEKGEKFASLMLADRLKQALVDLVVADVTRESLQSTKKLKEVAERLGIQSDLKINESEQKLNAAFIARNQIVHEMDLETETERRWNRRRRGKDEMARYAKVLLDIADKFIQKIDARLK